MYLDTLERVCKALDIKVEKLIIIE
ncbi:hypothetical protein [Alkalihalobacterium alkalicellulosilyticum]